MERLNKICLAQGAPGRPKEPRKPRGPELEQTDFILGRYEKLKIKFVWPREPRGAKMSPGGHGGANIFYFGPFGL